MKLKDGKLILEEDDGNLVFYQVRQGPVRT